MKRRLLIIVLLCCSAATAALAAVTNDEALSLFVKANFAYKDGDYAQAAQIYEQVLQDGKESGKLYYNLANSYFKQGQLGKAVLNFERALRLMPRDHDLKANARYTRSLLSSAEGSAGSWAEHAIRGFLRYFTVDEFTLAMLFLVILAVGLHAAALYGQWPRQRIRAALGCWAAVFLVCFCAVAAQVSRDRDLAIVLTETAAKFEPREDATEYFDLREGSEIKIVDHDGLWRKVIRSDGKAGWVPQEHVERVRAL